MPRSRLDKKSPSPLAVLLNGYVYADGGSLTTGAERTGIPRTTLYRKLLSPNAFTLDELLRICRQYSIPIDDLRAAIRL